jgi:hypothetical protein
MVLITSLGLFAAAAFERFKVDGMRAALFDGVAFPLFPGTSSGSVV